MARFEGHVLSENPGRIQDKKCSKDDCPKTYRPHLWGTRQANREGWFMQRNGDAWCPDHNPDWVAEWRAKKAKKTKEIN